MQKINNYFLMVLTLLMSIGLVVAIATTIGFATKAATREYEYESLRKEFQERSEKDQKQLSDALADLERRLNSEAYLNKRRYELLEDQLSKHIQK